MKTCGRALSLLAVALIGLTGGCGGVSWEHDQQTGLHKAVQARRRAVILFTSGFDRAANQMDSQVFSDPEVATLMQQFVAIRLDSGMNRQFVEQCGVQKTPAFVIVRPDLTVAGKYEGTMKADQFRLFLIRNSLN